MFENVQKSVLTPCHSCRDMLDKALKELHMPPSLRAAAPSVDRMDKVDRHNAGQLQVRTSIACTNSSCRCQQKLHR
jgi:hypothetical protein